MGRGAMAGSGPSYFGPMLIVRDFRASFRFYSEVVGVPGDGEPPYGEFGGVKGKFVILDGEFWKTVGGHALPSPSGGPREGIVLAIKVGDVDAAYARIRAAGVTIDSPPTDRPMMGLRNIQFRDPDGNVVELYSELPRPVKPPA